MNTWTNGWSKHTSGKLRACSAGHKSELYLGGPSIEHKNIRTEMYPYICICTHIYVHLHIWLSLLLIWTHLSVLTDPVVIKLFFKLLIQHWNPSLVTIRPHTFIYVFFSGQKLKKTCCNRGQLLFVNSISSSTKWFSVFCLMARTPMTPDHICAFSWSVVRTSWKCQNN